MTKILIVFCLVIALPFGSRADESKASKSTKKSFRILLALDFSGPLSTTARLLQAGTEIKRAEKAKSKIDIHVDVVDIGSDVKTIAAAVEKAIGANRPDLVLGAITSNQALVIGEITNRNNIIFITPFATNPAVTRDRPNVYRTCFDDNFQAQQLAKFSFAELNLRKGLVLFNQDQSYARGVRDIFSTAFKSYGATTLTEYGFSSEKEIDDSKIDEILKAKPEFVMIPSYQVESASLISKLIRVLPKNTVYLGTDSWGGGRIFERIVKSGDKPFKGFYVQHWSDQFTSKQNREFLKRLKKFKLPTDLIFDGTAMNAPIAMGYDAMGVAIEVLQKRRPGASGFAKLSYAGASGVLDYGDGQTPKKSLFIFQIDERGERFFREFK